MYSLNAHQGNTRTVRVRVIPGCAVLGYERMLFNVSATQGPSGAARIEDTVKDFWATRPRRPRRGRKIAGVAAGIANRYRIDPVLVRVGLVVAAIWGGSGVLVYLLGWLFLPEQDDEVSPIESLLGKGRSSTSSAFTVLLGIISVPVVGWFFSGSFTGEFSSWVSLLVLGGLLFLLHQARGHVTPIVSTPPPTPTPTPQPTMPLYSPMPTSGPMYPPSPVYPPMPQPMPQPTVSMPVMPPVGQPADVPPPVDEPRTTPPAWDPLGAAPFAWDLPEPSPPPVQEEPSEPPVKRRKPRVATATLGIVLVTAAGLALASNASVGWVTPPHAIGVILAIIGLGLVAGAFLRSGRGLIALAVPLSVVGMGMTAIGPEGYQGVGDLTASPTTLAAVQDTYQRSVGNVDLDLTNLPNAGELEVNARTDIGNVTVIVPPNADVTVTCETDAGNIDCLGVEQNGIDTRVELVDPGVDSAGTNDLKIELEVSADAGNVEVHRG
jgi:phage shock protein PspC (stress-responsive transcriptional regulator)